MRYFFDIRDDFYAARDSEGEELPSPEVARREAVKIATSIAADLFVANGVEVTITVRDEERSLFDISVCLRTKDLA